MKLVHFSSTRHHNLCYAIVTPQAKTSWILIKVNGGVHLEHFHSYQTNKKVGADNNSSNNNIEDDSYEDREEEKKTIEFHTDQGFFIAFTPGMILSPTATQQE